MIEIVLHFIESTLVPLGGWGVFLASVIEEVLAPVPSALVITLSGFVFLKGGLSLSLISTLFFVVVLPASVGITVGSLFLYSIAFFVGKPFLLKWGPWIGLPWSDIEKLQARFETKKVDEIGLVVLRALPIVPSLAVSAFYGLLRFNIYSYLLYTFIGTLFRSTFFAILGWQAGGLYATYAQKIAYFEKGILLLIAVCAISFVLYKIYKKRSV